MVNIFGLLVVAFVGSITLGFGATFLSYAKLTYQTFIRGQILASLTILAITALLSLVTLICIAGFLIVLPMVTK
jgi:hypothetical protein